MNYAEFIQLPNSEKIILATCKASERVKIFTDNTTHFTKSVTRIVDSVSVNGESLAVGAMPLDEDEFYFNHETLELHVRLENDENPKTKNVVITYKFLFSNAPLILPHDLASGYEVEWEPRILSIGQLGQQLDNENTGIVLESSSSIVFENSDGYFDSIYDTLIWDNKDVDFYFWSPLIPLSEKLSVFSGVVSSRQFSSERVTFKINDFVFKLRKKVDLGLFSSSDGTLLPSSINKPKRRLYGQFKQLSCTPVDCVLDGFLITGTIGGDIGTDSIIGTGTDFLNELSVGDELSYSFNGVNYKTSIKEVLSATSATFSSEIKATFNGVSATVKPSVPYRKKNRAWHVAGHKLSSPSYEVVSVLAGNRFELDSVVDLFTGDSLNISGVEHTVRRIFGNVVVLNNTPSPTPVVSSLFTKNPVTRVFFGSQELEINRDWSVTNTTECKVEFEELAEFNVATPISLGATISFINGSRTLTTTDILDFRSILKPRDWIRKDLITETDYYEILEVKEQSIILRTPFTGATASSDAIYKSVTYIEDESLITVDCYGLERSGSWIKTASDSVRDLILNDAGLSSVNEASFSLANDDCDYILSLAIPHERLGQIPEIRKVINDINQSVFGSLYGDSANNIKYSILSTRKPELISVVRDDDLLDDPTFSTEQNIFNESIVNYRPFIDIFSGGNSFEQESHNSGFVDSIIGVEATNTRTAYLFNQSDAETIAQRVSFYFSMANTITKVKSKLNLSTLSVNDKVFLEIDRLFERYAGGSSQKIGIVNGVKKNGYDVEVQFIDLGNAFNRVMSIAPNSTNDFSSATDDEKLFWGYIVDNDTETPGNSSEESLGSNLIG